MAGRLIAPGSRTEVADTWIRRILREQFGLPCLDAQRIPGGDSASAYVAAVSRDSPKLVKVYRRDDWGAVDIARIECGAVICDLIGGALGPVQVPRPARTVAGDWVAHDGQWFATVQEFAAASPHEPHDEQRIAEKLGEALSILHDTQTGTLPLPERDIRFIPGDDAEELMSRLKALPGAKAALAAELWPRARIGRLLCRLQELRPGQSVEPSGMVLSHGDVTMANLMMTAPESVALIDWDGVYRAPPEFEFAPLAMERQGLLPAMLAAYRSALGRKPADPRLIEFHMGRYNLFGLSFHLRRWLRSASADPAESSERDSSEAIRYLCQAARMRDLVRQMELSCRGGRYRAPGECE
jgi:Ser/Thr protein kinase RdoA (MazF antagonist)